jgi:hypothetical protein
MDEMDELKDDELIEYSFPDLSVAKMITKNFASWVLPYDIYFTNNGIAFVNTVGVKKSVMIRDVKNATSGNARSAQEELSEEAHKAREKWGQLSLQEMLNQSSESFYLAHSSIQTVTLKKKLFYHIGKLILVTEKGRWVCEFPMARMEGLELAVKSHLTDKLLA